MNRFATMAGVGTLVLELAAFAVAGEAVRDAAPVPTGKLDPATSSATIRASQLIGMNIQDSEGKSLGTVEDIVLDANRGKVRYAAVSYGGFLGMGDKLFAVPWAAFTVRQGNEAGEFHLVLNAREEQLKSAPGFDKDQWPDFADHTFTASLDRHYGIELLGRRGRGVDVEVGPAGVDVDVDTTRDR